MARSLNKRSLTVAGHRTSVSLEEPFWNALTEIAREEGKSIAGLIGEIDKARGNEGSASNLSASIRLFVLERMQPRKGPAG